MKIDLHTHSRVSDGTDTPEELVRSAYEQGLDVLGITDHDTTEGWEEAAETATDFGLTLVRGIEISTKLGRESVHLLAYLPDPTYPPLVEALERILDGRDDRVPKIVGALNGLGIDITVDAVKTMAGEAAATGRPHVADVLVANGVVANRDEAFSEYLSPGRPAYVERYAAGLEDTIGLVRDAGGVTVLAHPWGRHAAEGLDEAGIARLVEIGLTGIEVDHQDHAPEVRDELRDIAGNLGIVVTGSSDYHGLGKTNHDLACNTTDPDEYARLVEAASQAAEASGRNVPGVLA